MHMDLRMVEEIVNDSKGGIIEKKEAIVSTLSNPTSDADSDAGVSNPTTPPVDAASALQLFLDHIPNSSIPGIHNSPSTVLVVRTQECVKDVIKMLYEKNVSGALIADGLEPDPTATFTTSFSHPYVGFISFSNSSSTVLQACQIWRWKAEEEEVEQGKAKGKSRQHGFVPQYYLSEAPKFMLITPPIVLGLISLHPCKLDLSVYIHIIV